MEKINRNDLCPCGSRKKYKKCCGAHDAVAITEIIENEIDELQKQFLHFATYHFATEILDDFEELEQMIDIDNEQEFYELVHAIWFSLFEELDDGTTIVEKFITTETSKMKRPKLKQILQSWASPRAIAGKVIHADNHRLIVEDGFTSEQLNTVMVNPPFPIEEGAFFIGILLPYEQQFVFFPSPFVLPELKPKHAIAYIKDTSIDADYDNPQEYLTDFFLEVLSELPMVGSMLGLDDLEWPSPVYQKVANLFKEKLELLVPPPAIDTGVILWHHFCQKKQKRIQNPNIYVAALHYLLSTFVPVFEPVTQKELAKQYGVSAGSISSVVSELEFELVDDIAQLIGMVYGNAQASNIPSIESASVIKFPETKREFAGSASDSNVITLPNAKMAPVKTVRKVSRRDEERARDLIYDALQTEGLQRYTLAQEALKLNPNCVDAYVILAEQTKSLEEAILLYEQGIKAGEKELGKAFFKENKGYFWGLIETRPFMRAKVHYAEALTLLGKITEAVEQYKELLELNPMDNQGVRYSLFVAYLDLGDFEKAGDLLARYEEDSAQNAYNKVLLELHKNGFTKKAASFLKLAKRENKYVIPYLTGLKRLPDYPPDYYGMGDENEAIVYADMHLHLWRKIEGLGDWLKRMK